MWSQQCYLDFDRGANHHAQLHIHSGKIVPPLSWIKVHGHFFLVCSFNPFAPIHRTPRATSTTWVHWLCLLIGLIWPVSHFSQATCILSALIYLQQRINGQYLSIAPLSASNTSLNYLRSTKGRSYMCNTEQTLAVVPNFSLNTFRLQVQPFEVTTNQFATGTKCLFCLSCCYPKFLSLK